jgi:hypothetical protein
MLPWASSPLRNLPITQSVFSPRRGHWRHGCTVVKPQGFPLSRSIRTPGDLDGRGQASCARCVRCLCRNPGRQIGADLVADPFLGDLALELGKRQQHVEGQTAHCLL